MTVLRATIVVVVVLVTVTSCSKPAGDGLPQPSPQIESSEASPSPSLRVGVPGQPFDVPGWRITVTAIRCDKTVKLLPGDTSTVGTPDVCIAYLSLVNTSNAPKELDDSTDFAGFDQSGRRFDGFRWAHGTINPGVKDDNQLVFAVPPDAKIQKVQIVDVMVG